MTDHGEVQLKGNTGHLRRGKQGALRARRPWVLFGLAAVVVLIIGVVWVVMVRHHRSELDQADREIAARRYGAARRRLTGISTRWMGPDAVDYRLGLCEGSLGHDEAALEAWGRLPTGSPFAEAAALNSAAVELNRGRFSAAEPILTRALAHPDRQVVTVGKVLSQLLWEQGRADEMRVVIESSWRHASRPDWPRPDEVLGLLRDHIGVDFESLAVDAFRTILERAGRQAPEDDRVWLGWANLAIRTARSPRPDVGSTIASGSGRRTRRSGRPSSIGDWPPSGSTRFAVP